MAALPELAFAWGGRTIRFDVQRSARATLRIAVSPEGNIRVDAPQEASEADVIARVRRRAGWIMRQLMVVTQWQLRTPPRQYESGETHLYLGRQYRLLVAKGSHCSVILAGDRLLLTLPEAGSWASRQTLLHHWYRLQAHRVFRERLAVVEPPFIRLGVARPPLIIRKLEHRWGSFTAKSNLVLNLDLIRASVHLIDYVIVHELAHAVIPNHGNAWRELLSRVMPDWPDRKASLEHQLL